MTTMSRPGEPGLPPPDRRQKLRTLLQGYYEGQSHLRRGLCMLSAGRYDDALTEFTAAERVNPDSLPLPGYLAAAHLGHGRYDQAAEALDRAAAHEPKNVVAQVRYALAVWKTGRTEASIELLREAISRNPESAELQFQLATILATEGLTDEAELRFTQATAIDPEHVEALVGLAMCHGVSGNTIAAVAALRRAQGRAPHNSRVALLLTHALKAADSAPAQPVRIAMPEENTPRDERTIDELAAVIEAEPDFVESFLSLDPEEVNAEVFTVLVNTINRALERSPEHADLHYHCGCLLLRLGRMNHAIAAVERAVRLRPTFTKALIQLAKLYQRGDREADARARLEEVIRLGVEYADVYCLLGNLYRDGGMLKRAREAYRHALGINPNYRAAREALAAVST